MESRTQKKKNVVEKLAKGKYYRVSEGMQEHDQFRGVWITVTGGALVAVRIRLHKLLESMFWKKSLSIRVLYWWVSDIIPTYREDTGKYFTWNRLMKLWGREGWELQTKGQEGEKGHRKKVSYLKIPQNIKHHK